MAGYIPSTEKERQEMLESLGLERMEQLFRQVPEAVKLKGLLDIPSGCSELETSLKLAGLASKNKTFDSCFRGAGAYRHYIPPIVKSVTEKEEFVTAYTPYQAEISQGILQSIFEYQTMICELTGMDVSNASVYDGASAAAEAVFMCRDRKKTKAYVSETVNPQVMRVVETYCEANGTEVVRIPAKDGRTNRDLLAEALGEGACCVLIQQPNYFGLVEDGEAIGEITHKAGAKLVMSVNPISLGLMKTPAEWGADIAVGEGQPLGMPLSFGGPYLGFMACKKDLMRKLPGRIVGETTDVEAKRAFVLTLQAREQHIRREKAGSNICSNQALCAMTASVYLTAVGPEGLEKTANLCCSKAHYMADRLEAAGLVRVHSGEYFHEFVTETPIPAEELETALQGYGILSGLPLGEREMLWCATEMNTKEEIDRLVSAVKEVCGQ